jgi:hypothetical protein
MAKPAKRRKKAPKLRHSGTTAIRESLIDEAPALQPREVRESVEGPVEDDPAAEDAWLLEREAEDIQRGDR